MIGRQESRNRASSPHHAINRTRTRQTTPATTASTRSLYLQNGRCKSIGPSVYWSAMLTRVRRSQASSTSKPPCTHHPPMRIADFRPQHPLPEEHHHVGRRLRWCLRPAAVRSWTQYCRTSACMLTEHPGLSTPVPTRSGTASTRAYVYTDTRAGMQANGVFSDNGRTSRPST